MNNSPNNIASIKFPINFNVELLIKDLNKAIHSEWVEHFNKQGYEGNWKAISLLSQNGESTNIFAHPTSNEELQSTEILNNCSYFKEVLNFFECSILSARILKLESGAVIKPHFDHELGYEDGTFRIHIPIQTNSNVEFKLEGKIITMLPGECWYTNVNLTHSVKNLGSTDRFHLVIDGERNDWSDKLFFAHASKDKLLSKVIVESSHTIKRTIEELKRQNNPNLRVLINELEEKLATLY